MLRKQQFTSQEIINILHKYIYNIGSKSYDMKYSIVTGISISVLLITGLALGCDDVMMLLLWCWFNNNNNGVYFHSEMYKYIVGLCNFTGIMWISEDIVSNHEI